MAKKNGAGARARTKAGVAQEASKSGRDVKRSGYALAAGGGLTGSMTMVAAGAVMAAGGSKIQSKAGREARDGRNRGRALDYAAQRRNGGDGKVSGLVRGPVQVTRNGKTFTRQQMIRSDK